MATKSTRRTTVADLIAASELGAIDPSTEVVTAADAEAAMAATAQEVGRVMAEAAAERELPATEHACGIAGCKHGAAHSGITQPDRQVKLTCPDCHAVARMTHRAIAASVAHGGGIRCGADGATFVVAERRTYRRGGTK